MGRSLTVPDTATGLAPLRADVELVRGVIVTGRVFNKATGQGIAEGLVQFQPLPENGFANTAPKGLANNYTDADGRFRLVTIPGPGVLLAQAGGTRVRINDVWVTPYKAAEFSTEDRKRVKVTEGTLGRELHVAPGSWTLLDPHSACKVLDLKEGGDPVSCDLEMDPGKALTVHLADPEGKPLAGVIAAGVSAVPLEAVFLDSAACPVYGLDSRQRRQLLFLQPERHLGAVVTLSGDESEPTTVRLGPTGVLTGRVLDADGKPIAGAEVVPLYSAPAAHALGKQLARRTKPPRTDARGGFRLPSIVPGFNLTLGFVKGRQHLEPEARLAVKALEAGKTQELGDIRMKRLSEE
jgi:hypothetical protein